MTLNAPYIMGINPLCHWLCTKLTTVAVFSLPQAFVVVQWLGDGFLPGVSHHRPARHLQRRQRLPTGTPVRHGQRQSRG